MYDRYKQTSGGYLKMGLWNWIKGKEIEQEIEVNNVEIIKENETK